MIKRLSLGLLALFLFLPAHATENLSNLISEARLLVLDSTSTSRQRFSDSQITELLNQAQRVAVSRDHCIQSSFVFQLVPGTTYYALPSNYDAMLRVTVGSKWLQEMTPAGLDGRSRGWEASSGYPTYYFINFSSRSLVGFAPWPATSADTDTVKVEYDISANDLVNSADLPFNGVNELQQYNHMLVYYAASVMAALEGLPTQAQSYMAMYETQYKSFDEHCIERPNYLPSGVGQQ